MIKKIVLVNVMSKPHNFKLLFKYKIFKNVTKSLKFYFFHGKGCDFSKIIKLFPHFQDK